MLSDATPPLSEHTIPAYLHGYSYNPLCQAPLNLFCLFLRNARRDVSFFFLLRVKRKWMLFFFSCWFIVLILYSDFFCNVCFLRKEIKCILILKKKSWPYPICSAQWLDQPSLPIYSYPFIHLPHPQSHQLNCYCWYPFFVKRFVHPLVFHR